ncbi:twin-arginine translocase TatA/TatE family subunit [Deinococcus sp. JMULE3]|uniref:twin-arginine translocase TatA/TatE family subunit n=1 Tax=Deinococcus sp. JMULE3 TaxID=2518341 RepID=UPI0015773159|nr:twin-arginine translocase TatA/TatE family subunit [Deinococcus sp. JMULE3]NTY02195.1 twin-arginine translocase TatA/TatE family subunit [Deinococcus sp. JMULE3]
MPNIGPAELLVVLLVALVVFGPRKLPELGKSLGNGLREFRRSTQGLRDDLNLTATPATQPAPVTQPAAHLPAAHHAAAHAVTAAPAPAVQAAIVAAPTTEGAAPRI